MKKQTLIRVGILCAIVLLVAGFFVQRLLRLQVAEGAGYLEQATSTVTIRSTITAARGEIVDCYGRVIAGNRVGYVVQLNKLYLPDEKLNDTLQKVVEILQQDGESWNDSLPMADSAPYDFTSDEEAVQKLKTTLSLSSAATAENVWYQMLERYGLQGYSAEWQRILAGIRYTMELKVYSAVTPFVLASDVSIGTASIVEERNLELVGVEITEESIRYYADGTLMPHILGTVGPIYAEEYDSLKGTYSMNAIIGKSGLEKAYENDLRGTDGELQTVRTADGVILSSTVTKEPVAGNTVVLTIDSQLQSQLNTILANLVTTIGNLPSTSQKALGKPKGAAAVVIDTRTGGILAASTYPSYDLNLYTSNYSTYLSDPLNPLFNRAFYGTYRPGSVFKTVVGLAGLIDGTIDASSTVYCSGTYMYYAPTYTPGCLQHGHGNGPIAIRQALMDSCNIFFYDVGRRVGYADINKTAEALGLGVNTGVEIGEATGSLSSPELRKAQIEAGYDVEDWQEGDILQASIGQLDTRVTPLQLATYAGALANHGVRYRTHLVGATASYDYSTMNYVSAEIMGKIDDDYAFSTVEEGMVMASRYGSSSVYLGSSPYTIATKTGTPQVTDTTTNGTIIAYGPTEDSELAVAIVVENCANGYWLSAGVSDIFDAYYASKNQAMSALEENVLLG